MTNKSEFETGILRNDILLSSLNGLSNFRKYGLRFRYHGDNVGIFYLTL